MANENEDVKPNAADSSSAQDVKPADSASSAAAVAEPAKTEKAPTVQDIVEGIVERAAKAESSTAEDEAEESDSTIEPNEGKEGDSEVEEADAEEKSEKKDDEAKGPVPYDRFREVNEKARTFEEKLKSYEPLVQAQETTARYCQENEISPDDFRQALEMAALAKKDPIAFYERIKGMVDELAPTAGDKLPKDLADAVEAGTMTLEYAQRLAKAEAKARNGEKRVQLSAEQVAQREAQRLQQDMLGSVTAWINQRKTTDPDFAPKASESEPDGKYEAFLAKLAFLSQGASLKTSADAIALVEKAYSAVNGFLSRITPKAKGTRRVLSSDRSSTTTDGEPKSIRDVVNRVARAHGLSV